MTDASATHLGEGCSETLSPPCRPRIPPGEPSLRLPVACPRKQVSGLLSHSILLLGLSLCSENISSSGRSVEAFSASATIFFQRCGTFQENEVANLPIGLDLARVFVAENTTKNEEWKAAPLQRRERPGNSATHKGKRGPPLYFTPLHSTFYFYFFYLVYLFLKPFRKSFCFSNVSPCCPLFALFSFLTTLAFCCPLHLFFALYTFSSPFFPSCVFYPFWTLFGPLVYPCLPTSSSVWHFFLLSFSSLLAATVRMLHTS